MRILYSIVIYCVNFVIKTLSIFNVKLKQGVIGRKETFTKLKTHIKSNDKTFWFHCASLGEYEQGLPVFETLKTKYPNYKIIISFFSPSGYTVRKDSKIADIVVYLPLDTKANAKRFLDLVKPHYIIFVKYEVWPNLLREVKNRNLKAVLISAVFRKEHSFFKWYGKFMRVSLFAFYHIFTQDKNSKNLLETINYKSVSVSGDTRFDRVINQLKIDNTVSFIEEFKNKSLCIVFGSTWPDDDKLYIDYINKNVSSDLKFIIAPHNIKRSYVNALKKQLTSKTICYSEKPNKILNNYNVFILDTVGYLSKIYNYANIAYVGGAAGNTGLHNILEPAVFGIPIIIGKRYKKFPEAKALIALGGVKTVLNQLEFENSIEALVENSEKREQLGSINRSYVAKNKGAILKILKFIDI